MDTPTKICRVCGLPKPYSELKKNKNQPDGVEQICIECNRDEARRYYANHAEQVKERLRAEYKDNPERVKARNKKSRNKPENKAKAIAGAKEWQRKNPGKVKVYKKRYRDAHKAEMRALTHAYYISHKKLRLEQDKVWKKANPEKTHAINVRSMRKNSEKRKQYRENNKLRYRAYAQNRRARRIQLPATFSDADWGKCLEYWGHCCAYCGQPQGLWHILAQDHFIPVTSGGGYTPDNILPACHAKKDGEGCCNNEKHNRDPLEWLVEKLGARRAKAKMAEIAAYFASLKK